MKTAVFLPVWGAFNPDPVTESMGIRLPLPVSVRALINLDPGEDRVLLTAADAPFVTTFWKDRVIENSISFEPHESGGTVVTFTPTMDDVGILEIAREAELTCSIFAGSMVPGLTTAGATITGVVSNIPFKQPTNYRFGIRVHWEEEVADAMVNWLVTPLDNQISWNYDILPTPSSSPDISRQFHTLGEFKRGQLVEIIFDFYNPDNTPFDILIRESEALTPDEDSFDGSLPEGLEITNNPFIIKGFIPAEAIPGDYYFEAYSEEPMAPTPIVLHIRILESSFDTFTAVNRLTWVSPDHLGTIIEGHPCHLSVKAQHSNFDPVTYQLAAGSRPLPVGLTLAPNGELRGLTPHVPADANFEFTVKASSGLYVATKKFTFRIKSSFILTEHLTVSLPLSGDIRRAWEDHALGIDLGRRFRRDDPLFGRALPRIMLIRGLRKLPIPQLDFDEPFKLIVGPVKVAKAVVDGVHIYDVIYREFFDPMQHAGGFVASDTDVIESPAIYPQDPSVIIHEGTLNNLRKELALKVGLNAPPAKRLKLGVNGGELLDQWMLTKQSDGKVPGYVGCAIVDYILPGQAQYILDTVNLNIATLPVGSSVEFDRLLVEDGYAPFQRIFGSDEDSLAFQVKPMAPLNLRVDGIPAGEGLAINHPTPQLTWQAPQPGVTFKLKIYDGAGALLRTENDITGLNFYYEPNLQTADGNPGTATVEVFSVKDGVESDPSTITFVLFGGWGRSYGFRWGGGAL